MWGIERAVEVVEKRPGNVVHPELGEDRPVIVVAGRCRAGVRQESLTRGEGLGEAVKWGVWHVAEEDSSKSRFHRPPIGRVKVSPVSKSTPLIDSVVTARS